jgi:ribosome-associated translation inhibitor RaiA
LRQGYADLLRGSTAIKGYLASTVKLVEQRDAVLEKLGVLKTQRKIVNLAVKLNDGAVMALENAGKVEEGIDNFVEKMEKVKKKLKKIEEGEITNGI